MFIKVVLWAMPVVCIVLSYFFYKYVPFRKIRYSLYAAVLVTGFFFNLFQVSFRNGIFDTAFMQAINFIVLEFAWHLLRIPIKKAAFILLVIVLGGYCGIHARWLFAGPANGLKLWKPVVTGTYQCKFGDYRVEEREVADLKKDFKILTLSKTLGILPLEKKISSYRVPEGFFHLRFINKWSETGRGVRLDLFYDTYTVWTLGEGF